MFGATSFKSLSCVQPVMIIEMDVSLDDTLGCGQAHRWKKIGGVWTGVLNDRVLEFKETGNGFVCSGTSDKKMILDYFRAEDDLGLIYREISEDPHIERLVKQCHGLRILKQEPWECTATYLLATNANVKRIGTMVENVCRTSGKDLGGFFTFPTPDELLAHCDDICECRLGYRDIRLLDLARSVADGELDLNDLRKADYKECIDTLKTVNGIGDKVADCIALFSYGHLEAFPIDARIKRKLKDVYDIDGTYAHVSSVVRKKFGRFGGYAQEFLYHCN